MRRLFNKAIRTLLLTNALILVAGAMLGPIYALFVEEIGGSLLDASYAFGVFSLVAGVASLIAGHYSDQLKENELIVILGYAVMGVGFWGYTLVSSILSLLVVQVVIGLGQAIYAPAFDAIYSRHIDGHRFGREWGAWEAAAHFTTGLGAVIGGLLVVNFGFNVIFVIMGLLCFASAIYLFFLPRSVL